MLKKLREKLSSKKKPNKKTVVAPDEAAWNTPVVAGDSGTGMDDTYLFDFRNWGAGNTREVPVNSITFMGDTSGVKASGAPDPVKLEIKPVDALKELETVPTPWTLSNLDDKIALFKAKEKMVKQHYAKREITALLERFENRKKYPQFRNFFEGFQNTTDEKIDVVLSKYKLVMKTSDIFIPEFPAEAINVMERYSEEMIKLCDKKPVFYVIATEDNFKKSYEKRDPILLVQSPFGFYWQILGAWDKEMLLLSEL